MDKKDARILRHLVVDSRTPLSRIALRVGLTDNGVRYRIRRMEERGIIRGYTALVDRAAMGRPLSAVLRVRADPGSATRVAARLSASPVMSQVLLVAGASNIVAIGDFEGPEELRGFLRAHLEGEGVQAVEVDIVTQAVRAGPRSP